MSVEATIEDLRGRPRQGETIPIIDPVTEQEIAEFVDGGAAAIDAAAARAGETFESGVWHDTIYGLAASAWTRDVSHAHRLAKRLDAGTVSINCQEQDRLGPTLIGSSC